MYFNKFHSVSFYSFKLVPVSIWHDSSRFDSFLAFWYIPSSCTFPAPVLETDFFFSWGAWFLVVGNCSVYYLNWFCLNSWEIHNQNTLSTHRLQMKYTVLAASIWTSISYNKNCHLITGSVELNVYNIIFTIS